MNKLLMERVNNKLLEKVFSFKLEKKIMVLAFFIEKNILSYKYQEVGIENNIIEEQVSIFEFSFDCKSFAQNLYFDIKSSFKSSILIDIIKLLDEIGNAEAGNEMKFTIYEDNHFPEITSIVEATNYIIEETENLNSEDRNLRNKLLLKLREVKEKMKKDSNDEYVITHREYSKR